MNARKGRICWLKIHLKTASQKTQRYSIETTDFQFYWNNAAWIISNNKETRIIDSITDTNPKTLFEHTPINSNIDSTPQTLC